jgi:hypothetical protein
MLQTDVSTKVTTALSVQKFLPDDEAVIAEMCGRMLIIIHLFYCIWESVGVLKT